MSLSVVALLLELSQVLADLFTHTDLVHSQRWVALTWLSQVKALLEESDDHLRRHCAVAEVAKRGKLEEIDLLEWCSAGILDADFELLYDLARVHIHEPLPKLVDLLSQPFAERGADSDSVVVIVFARVLYGSRHGDGGRNARLAINTSEQTGIEARRSSRGDGVRDMLDYGIFWEVDRLL